MSGDSEEAKREERLTAPHRYREREAELLRALAWKVVADPNESAATREAAERRLTGADEVNLELLSEAQLEFLERVLARGRGELPPDPPAPPARAIADAAPTTCDLCSRREIPDDPKRVAAIMREEADALDPSPAAPPAPCATCGGDPARVLPADLSPELRDVVGRVVRGELLPPD